MKKIHCFCFQVFFFALSTFVLHLALLDFIGNYRNSVYEDWNQLTTHLSNVLLLLAFDLMVGTSLGLLNGVCSVLFNENLSSLKTAVITTDIFWLLFCFWWYFNNRGVINVEAVGHLLSPFMVGFVGFVVSLINLPISLALSRANKK